MRTVAMTPWIRTVPSHLLTRAPCHALYLFAIGVISLESGCEDHLYVGKHRNSRGLAHVGSTELSL